jgi:hypothetical protein
MKIVVLNHCGPFSIEETTCPIQLSPAVQDALLCWDCRWVGVTTAKLGRVPLVASVITLALGTKFRACAVSRHLANEGQMAQ